MSKLNIDNKCSQCRMIKPWIDNDINYYQKLTISEHIQEIFKFLVYYLITFIMITFSFIPILFIQFYVIWQTLKILTTSFF